MVNQASQLLSTLLVLGAKLLGKEARGEASGFIQDLFKKEASNCRLLGGEGWEKNGGGGGR